MTDIEQKALALVNEVLEGKALNNTPFTRLPTAVSSLVLLRAIEQHETFKQEVSDAIAFALKVYRGLSGVLDPLKRFIIPKPKPDLLVEAIRECHSSNTYCETVVEYAEDLRAALEARGLEIRSKANDRH